MSILSYNLDALKGYVHNVDMRRNGDSVVRNIVEKKRY
jgi:hypothetical protein